MGRHRLEWRLPTFHRMTLQSSDGSWFCAAPLTTCTLLLALLVPATLSCAASTPAPKPPTTAAAGEKQTERGARLELREPEWLPPEGREMIAARMQRHAEDMMFLMASVVLLNHEVAAQLSDGIANEPRLARPAADERDTLNALLPGRFFELEDELRERSRAVAVAAKLKDNARLTKASGQLVETCVSCHAVYLQDHPADDDLEWRSTAAAALR